MTLLARIIATLAFLLLLVTGLGFVLVHFAGTGGPVIAAGASWKTILNGRLAGTIDKVVVAALPRTPGFDSLMSGLSYLVLRDAGPQVRAGCPDWLFITEELAEMKHGARNMAAHAAVARKIRDTLAAKGVALVVLPVRDKADLAKDHLCGLPVSPQSAQRTAAWAETSAALGLDSVDMAQDWPAPGYLRTDTHWDEAGARHSAELVAAEIRRKLGPGTDKITLETGQPEPYPGDLMRLAGLLQSWPWSGPKPDEVAPVSPQVARSGGLLDDVTGPTVVVAGSSFSRRSGFIDFLQAASGREAAQRSHDGGGFAGALLDILLNEPHILKETRLIVWEFSLRSLTYDLTDAERKFLGEGT